MSDHDGLITRIRQLRRATATRERPLGVGADEQPDRLRALEARVQHLEQQLDGLQDSVHRGSERQDKLIADLQTQVQPGAMGAALAEDQRSRGL
ncbi:MAG TPA: hypothetical protein VG405_13010 [Solirubrobacteraceae bacterium]|jgi:hypothetical protein|nr:hypothetical protein [Solirubrobacteraceae bacterium]